MLHIKPVVVDGLYTYTKISLPSKCMSFIQDDGSRIYAWMMYSNFGRQLLCKVIMAWRIELLRFTSVMGS